MTNRDNDGYESFCASIRQCFTEAVAQHGQRLFTTDAANLFDVFLDNLPKDARQHYTCTACRKFVNAYGGLVVIKPNGEAIPALWKNEAPELFRASVVEMRQVVKRANVTGVFLTNRATLGTPVTGGWHHMSVLDAPVFNSRLLSPFQAMAAKLEDYGILRRSLAEFTQATTETAV